MMCTAVGEPSQGRGGGVQSGGADQCPGQTGRGFNQVWDSGCHGHSVVSWSTSASTRMAPSPAVLSLGRAACTFASAGRHIATGIPSKNRVYKPTPETESGKRLRNLTHKRTQCRTGVLATVIAQWRKVQCAVKELIFPCVIMSQAGAIFVLQKCVMTSISALKHRDVWFRSRSK